MQYLSLKSCSRILWQAMASCFPCTVMRTMSAPMSAHRFTCSTVAATSLVSVVVIVCAQSHVGAGKGRVCIRLWQAWIHRSTAFLRHTGCLKYGWEFIKVFMLPLSRTCEAFRSPDAKVRMYYGLP